jgi:Xaa-Pro aminopeptidase
MKIKKLMRLLEDKEIQGVIITELVNIRYFTGFTGSTAVGLVTKNGKYLLVDFRYITQAKIETKNSGFEVIEIERPSSNKIYEIIQSEKITKLGIEDETLPLSIYNEFKNKFQGVELSFLGDSFTRIRMIKTPEEIEKIKIACDIADKALKKILPMIKVGSVEKDIKRELEYEMIKLGAEEISFKSIVASNERSALPHGVASDKKLENEGFVTLDFGCIYEGYASDITRTFYLGENPTEKHIDIYNIVLEAQKKAIEAVKEGVTSREIDKIARDYISQKGYGKYFGHGLGHGLGMKGHELPFLSPKTEEFTLKENMVITIEPGIYIDNFGGVRIEDDVIVKKDGCEILNNSSKEFTQIK